MMIAATPCGWRALPASVSMAIRRGLAPALQFINPLAAPAEADLIDLVAMTHPDTPWPRMMKRLERPTVILIGDDPGAPEGMGGPDAWRCTRKLSRWARAVLVHGTGGKPEHYAEAVRAARQVGQVVLIETTSMHARAWAARLGCPRTLILLPHIGAHPAVAEAL